VVINLATSNALPDEQALVERMGGEYIPIPVIWDAPALADIERFFAAMAAHQGQKLFVHCAANMRVSAFMYLYRTLQEGMDEAEAARDLHRLWTPNEVWQAFMDRVIAHYREA
jgi:protein tyrosine phosphatase (PTP) superfamily phosphohydrolase (DUF442 family)